jgi:hypothetical protein
LRWVDAACPVTSSSPPRFSSDAIDVDDRPARVIFNVTRCLMSRPVRPHPRKPLLLGSNPRRCEPKNRVGPQIAIGVAGGDALKDENRVTKAARWRGRAACHCRRQGVKEGRRISAGGEEGRHVGLSAASHQRTATCHCQLIVFISLGGRTRDVLQLFSQLILNLSCSVFWR